jgi:hypothetical protein
MCCIQHVASSLAAAALEYFAAFHAVTREKLEESTAGVAQTSH